MKKIICLIALLGAFFTSNAQKEEISMSAIMSDAIDYIKLIEMEYGQEIVRMEFDIINSTKQTIRTLTSDYEYGIVAFGDYRIKDIDIKVYKLTNGQWTLIEQDQETTSNAAVTIKPYITSEYKIEIKAYEFNSGYSAGHYGLIIFHE
ncbi:MAG: hypothetical protein IKW51_09795 [Bacteroidales bacterium]|nr:hypothetical protein [Bacteroidales bacterium]